MLKILATSDLHGNLPIILTPFDLLLICGDISPAHDHYYTYQSLWFQQIFAEWINMLPFKNEYSKVVMVGGNHDFFLERVNEKTPEIQLFNKNTNNRVKILKNEEYDCNLLDDDEGIKTLKIFGTPYCHIFGNWAFMISDEKLKKYYSVMPDNCDIVISHDSPTLNGLGTINQGWNAGYDAGNSVLSDIILEKKPKYFFSGHIHTGNHTFEKFGETMMANVSYIDEKYNPAFEILEFEV